MSGDFFDKPVEPVEPSPELKARILAKLDSTPQLPASDSSPYRPAAARARKRWSPRVTAIAGVAASVVALLAFVGIVGTFIGSSLPEPPMTDAEVLEQLDVAADTQRVATELESGETLTLVYSDSVGRAAVTWDDLPPLPGNDVYELWLIRDTAQPAGLVRELQAGYRVLEGEFSAGVSVGLTAEPPGGSATPTMDRLVAVWETAA